MIVQYIIDWKCVHERIDRADDLALERLRGCLSSIREKVAENGVLVVDEDTCLLNDLNAIKCELENLVSEDQPDCGAVYFDMKQELDSFLTAYENAGYIISVENREDVVQACVCEWMAHARRISPQGVKGGVVITDRRDDLDHGTLALECWESYGRSQIENLRRRWRQGLSFNEATRGDFLGCLNAIAMISNGDVLFFDRYWASIGVENVGGGATTKQMRYLHSTMLFLRPFLRNPDIKRVEFVTCMPTYGDYEQKCFCSQRFRDAIQQELLIGRTSSLSINVSMIEPMRNNHGMTANEATFHNRYIVNDQFTVALHNGMDVCNYDESINHFEISLFGRSKMGCGKLARGYIIKYAEHLIKEEEVDMCHPYIVQINENPIVTFSLNG